MSEQTVSVHPPHTGRSRPAVDSHPNTVLSNQAFTVASVHTGSAVATTAGEAPNQGFARSKWERRYAANLRITDTVVVCGAVLLAQYVRFGHTPTALSYMSIT